MDISLGSCKLFLGRFISGPRPFPHSSRQFWTAVLTLAVSAGSGCDSAAPTPANQPAKQLQPSATVAPATPEPVQQPESAVQLASASSPKLKTIAESARLESDTPSARDLFGIGVAVSGRYALIGSGGDDAQGEDRGAAFVFQRQEDNRWLQVAKLHGDDIRRHANFGHSVALDGNIAAVGANSAGASFAGAVYIFERAEDGTWRQTAKLEPSFQNENPLFGARVALSGGRLLVGAPQEGKMHPMAGAAYLFEREDDGSWREIAKLVGEDTAKWDQFGAALALSGDVAVVGSRHNENDTGSVYVFEKKDGSWPQTAKLKAKTPAPFRQFGNAVGVADKTILVGEWRNHTKGDEAGAVYLFQQDDSGAWQHANALFASDATPGDEFGCSIAMQRNQAVIGALHGVAGDGNACAYLFERTESNDWRQVAKLIASDGTPADNFSRTVAIDGKTVLVGMESLSLESAGAAYVFQ